ncbi:serine hydrolase domain-containing protein [Nocardioides iriomotensis]|uniref:serine hydrolase domain-containing protein n=1 Tax=Nocardioides iriomotensis TaxID=715784 RepID=UPI0013EA689C|nr:serine hydrolase domain-containing protein [Nocardioides iriomotensis]
MSGDLAATLERVVAPTAGRYVAVAAAATRAGATASLTSGVRDAERGGAVDEHTVFEIGSVTKVFTALLLADQVVAGAVVLAEPLQALLPDVVIPVRGRPVTLLDLATHTSGFPRLPPGLVRQALRHRDDPYARFTEDDLHAALERVKPKREPGGKWSYSNFGAAVLGHALARRAGTTYDRLLAERVTGPLGLADTVLALRPDQEDRRAHGHTRRGRPTDDWSMPAMPGMGALHSTVTDLTTFLRAQLDPESTPLAEAIRMTREPRAGREPMQVALGWLVSPMPKGGPVVHWHNGGTGGARSWAGFSVADDTTCVVLTTGQRSPDQLGFDVLRSR